jgi:putative tricarboxylic transport membrane protein
MTFGFDIFAVLEGFSAALTPFNVLIMFCGVVFGIILGIIPGLGPALGIALLIPFTFKLTPDVGMSLLTAVFVGGISGGCVTAILIRIPGTPGAIATLMDGYPMTQKGLAGQAIGNAVVASLVGTLISGVFLVTLAPILASVAVKFFFADYVAVCLFALTAVASITGNSLSRGLITALIGLLASCFGISQTDGISRFDFGILAMQQGVGIIPPLVGMYAISRVMNESIKKGEWTDSVGGKVEVTGNILPRLVTIKNNVFNYIRSALVGTFEGVIPAVGGSTAGLLAYSLTKNASKNPQKFGTGIPEGVIASETANNATIGGALIISITLGIPGEGASAVLLGGLIIHGITPGPTLFMNHPEVVYAIYFSLFVSALMMAGTMLTLARQMPKIVKVPKRILLPVLFVMATVATYALSNQIYNALVMCFFGALGYVLERFRYPLPPFILGLILGPLVEGFFRKMIGEAGSIAPMFTRPISLTFLILTAGFLIYSIRKQRKIVRQEAT